MATKRTPLEHIMSVIFRKYKDDGDIIAVFPYMRGGSYYECLCYQHIGQHGACHWSAVLETTVPATEEESVALYAELVRIGYDALTPRKRFPKDWLRFREDRLRA